MADEAAVGFWSYAHEDNEMDGGAILELARRIKEEYNLLSGKPLDLFVDRDIRWGEEWRQRINSSLAQTTFFIPVITPRYFTRPECLRELLEFAAKAKSLGVEELLLPILWVETENLSPDTADEAMALVARTQYEDWHEKRLLEPGSREYRLAVNVLARRLLEISRHVASVQLHNESNVNLDDDGIDGTAEIIERITGLLPDWLDAVIGEKTTTAQVEATWTVAMERRSKLLRSHAPASAILSAKVRMAKEMLPLLERSHEYSGVYLTRSIELDPLVSSLVRMMSEYPDTIPLAGPVIEAVGEAMEEINKGDEILRNSKGTLSIRTDFFQLRHLGRTFQVCHSELEEFTKSAREANEIVRRWNMELKAAVSQTFVSDSPQIEG